MVFEAWSVLTATLWLGVTGFSPVCAPLALFFSCWFPREWWAMVAKYLTPWSVTVYVLPAVAISTYWVNGMLLTAVDYFVRPEVLQPFKIQPGKRFDHQVLPKVCKNVLVGQFGVIVPYAFACGLLQERIKEPLGTGIYVDTTLPSGKEMLWCMFVIVIFNEFAFFYGHWALHQKIFGINFYARVHKQHHEFTSPVGIVASYCHPFEMLVSNAVPLTFGIIFVQCHAFTILVWTMFAVLGTQFHHCGYRWPWVAGVDSQPDFHDYHHEKFNANYGNIGFLDTLHGTDKAWIERCKERKPKPEHPLGKGMFVGVVATCVGCIAWQLVQG